MNLSLLDKQVLLELSGSAGENKVIAEFIELNLSDSVLSISIYFNRM